MSNFRSCPIEQGLEEMETDEAVDCRVIEQLRDEVLPHAHTIPKEFTLKVVVLLNKGSIHSATHTSTSGNCNLFNMCT
jgi:hypothetical protein